MKPRLITLVGIILLAAATRILPHPYNFAPITGMALFGGAYFSRKSLAFIVPLLAMLASDLVIGSHRLMLVTYLTFVAITCIGLTLQSRRSFSRVAGATFASSLLYFFTTNLGVWAFEALYPKTWEGLVTCFIAALPFLQNTLAGDALYAVVLFGGFALAQKWVPVLREPEVAISQ